MDYECDIGYIMEGGQCLSMQDALPEGENIGLDQSLEELEQKWREDQCAENGYYEVSTGWRKVPSNKCVGGLDRNPKQISCGIAGQFGWKSIFFGLLLVVIIYFGWNYVEAVLIALPLPDPGEMKEKLSDVKNKAIGMVSQRAVDKKKKDEGYAEGFDSKPATLDGDGSDEEDGTQDIKLKGGLNYDSDEGKDEDLMDFAARDRTSTAADNVPKLRKPK